MLVHHVIEHHEEGTSDGSVGELSATDLRDGTSEDGVSRLVRCFKDRKGIAVCKDKISLRIIQTFVQRKSAVLLWANHIETADLKLSIHLDHECFH